jgi:hypothetical protein
VTNAEVKRKLHSYVSTAIGPVVWKFPTYTRRKYFPLDHVASVLSITGARIGCNLTLRLSRIRWSVSSISSTRVTVHGCSECTSSSVFTASIFFESFNTFVNFPLENSHSHIRLSFFHKVHQFSHLWITKIWSRVVLWYIVSTQQPCWMCHNIITTQKRVRTK